MKESLWKESVKSAFCKPVVLFVLITVCATLLGNVLSGVGALLLITFSIVFGCYSYNLGLQLALKKYFKIDEIPIISANPKIGKSPAILFCWSLLFWLPCFGIGLLTGSLYLILTDTFGMIGALIIAGIIICVAFMCYTWFVFFPMIMQKSLGNNEKLKNDFIKNYDKKYYLIILIADAICVIAIIISVVVLISSSSFQSAIMSQSTDILTSSNEYITINCFMNVLVSLISGMFNVAGFRYAFVSWLEKSENLPEIGEYYKVMLKPKYVSSVEIQNEDI